MVFFLPTYIPTNVYSVIITQTVLSPIKLPFENGEYHFAKYSLNESQHREPCLLRPGQSITFANQITFMLTKHLYAS